MLAASVDDEPLGVRVEITLAERRRVHRVEQLLQLADMDVEPSWIPWLQVLSFCLGIGAVDGPMEVGLFNV